MGVNPEVPILDPCLPVGLEDIVEQNGQTWHVRGKGDWQTCTEQLHPLLAGDNGSHASLSNTYRAPIDFANSEFYGFSEFYYCTEDVLRLGGQYHAPTFTRAAQVGVTGREGKLCDYLCLSMFGSMCGFCAKITNSLFFPCLLRTIAA